VLTYGFSINGVPGQSSRDVDRRWRQKRPFPVDGVDGRLAPSGNMWRGRGRYPADVPGNTGARGV